MGYLPRFKLFINNVVVMSASIFVLFFILLVLIYLFYSSSVRELGQDLYNGEIESHKMYLNSQLMEIARSRTRLTSKIIDTEDVFEQDEIAIQLDVLASRFSTLRSELIKLPMSSVEEKIILEELPKIVSVILPNQRSAVELAMQDDLESKKKSNQILYDVVLPGQQLLIEKFLKLIELEQSNISRFAHLSRIKKQQINSRIELLVLVLLTLVVLISIIVIRRIWKIQNELFTYQNDLESTVEKRTSQLVEVNHKLEASIDNMKVAQDKLIESEKMSAVSSLMAGVAYEVHNPIMNSLSSNSDFIEHLGDIIERFDNNQLSHSEIQSYFSMAKQSSRDIDKNLRNAENLISSFKQLSVDHNIDHSREFELCNYINEIVISVLPQFTKTPHSIELECDKLVTVHSDPGVISQIILNLVMNSLQHGFDDEFMENNDEKLSGKVIITVTKTRQGGRIVFSDNGKGIDMQHLGKVFEPFYTTRRLEGSTGLGMYITYNLVTQKLFGKIHCESEQGKGTKFIIDIPFKHDNTKS